PHRSNGSRSRSRHTWTPSLPRDQVGQKFSLRIFDLVAAVSARCPVGGCLGVTRRLSQRIRDI
ncbi:MAG TPA: hypothetical protein VEO55_02240, partial [Candidatus Dormibacteraeota bacterium]|nr:hypothetical protein [Candidatus Dormibacteraeota bacterium]